MSSNDDFEIPEQHTNGLDHSLNAPSTADDFVLPDRIDQNFSGALGYEQALSVSIERPRADNWIRVHAGEEFRRVVPLIQRRVGTRDEFYWVSARLREGLEAELTGWYLLPVTTKALNVKYGELSLWPIRSADRGGSWIESAQHAATIAMKSWIRLKRGADSYQPLIAKIAAEPNWPEWTLAEWFRRGFGERYLIKSIDHPLLRDLRGED